MTRLQPVAVAETRSLWLQEALAQEPDDGLTPAASGALRADVCIVGGGYTGLWTALRIKDLDPSVDVMVLEADICGGGASGRNGGLALGWWGKLSTLVTLFGEEEGLRLARAAGDAVTEIGDFCVAHGIDAHFRQQGLLRTITTPLHAGKWEATVAACESRGIDVFERLTPDQIQQRAGSSIYLEGVLERGAATLQPALLARGLRKVALSRGVRIHERSPVTEIVEGTWPAVRTPRAVVAAEQVVLATNAWLASLHVLRRAMIVVSSDMVATAPAPERIAAAGWVGGEGITDARLMVHYHQVTHDGRIAIGRGSGALAYLGRVTRAFNESGDRQASVVSGLRFLYPNLTDLPITHAWTGPIDRTRTGTLICGPLNGRPSVIYGAGFSGTGVAPSLVASRILASSALGRVDEWSATPLNRGPLLAFPPEPVRFFGGLFVRANVYRKEEGEQQGQPAGRTRKWLASQAAPRLPRQQGGATRRTAS